MLDRCRSNRIVAGLLVLVAGTTAAGEQPAGGDAAAGRDELRIVVGFEGSCPQSLEGVKREGP